MVKFILIMYLCSGTVYECKPLPQVPFDSYRECAIAGYTMTAEILTKFTGNEVEKYRMYSQFICEEQKTI